MSTALASETTTAGETRRNQTRLRMHAPSSIQVGPPSGSFAEWKVAIPLLSPLDIVSFPSIGDLRPPYEESPKVVAEVRHANREWRAPAAPFHYESAPANAPAFAVFRCS
ncbi:uncharacterized protein At4g14450, chloroplastic-like [Phalaenopsis equestris]|uniref:uncharacterized protein At4g14450, chloroplastic-like n=1 Tax=Phalaenopsis equestris TaxID=78828 RepID=UPI0009E206C4|nr:uncharacterized protein At4g14450, chloroplastic-like [Phalaenopsis equestris]